ncbi:hypothetical protein [uncultured Corynebacterium sp.]|mgnify:CR=1 FL=1|uniref:hypothetical protein n=1 Tax=uncultured Corynebacterium sp. TaxID=159447 RepID=UPI0025E68ADC|nr:hypothetical protein [uncultured Corynebacterium sp.]
MSRHDETPITNRVIPPSHPTVQGAQRRLISEIDEWLDEDDDYTDDAMPYELDKDQRVHLADYLVIALLTTIVAFVVFQVAWHLGKVLV